MIVRVNRGFHVREFLVQTGLIIRDLLLQRRDTVTQRRFFRGHRAFVRGQNPRQTRGIVQVGLKSGGDSCRRVGEEILDRAQIGRQRAGQTRRIRK